MARRLEVRVSVDERRTIREIQGIPLPVIEHSSERRAAIEQGAHGKINILVAKLVANGGIRARSRRIP